MFNQQVISRQQSMQSAPSASVPNTSFSQIQCSDGSSGWRSDVGNSSLYFCPRGSAPSASSSGTAATAAINTNTAIVNNNYPYSSSTLSSLPSKLPTPGLSNNNSLGTMLPPSWNVSNLKFPWSSSSSSMSKSGQIQYNIPPFGQLSSMNPLGSLSSLSSLAPTGLTTMMKQPTAYFNSFYNKVRHLLAGQGVEDVGNIDLTAAKVSIDKLGDCIEKMSSDPVLMPEAHTIIRNWYVTIYRPLFSKLTDPSDALITMSNSERERVFVEADDKFAELIKGKPYEQAVYNHFLKCFA